MTRVASDQPERVINSNLNKPYHFKQQHSRSISPFSRYSPKLSIYLLVTCAFLFMLFQIQSLQTPSLLAPSSQPTPSWNFMRKWQINTFSTDSSSSSCTQELKATISKLRDAVTFLPLKDLRYSSAAQQGHTWFMSSMYDTHEEGEVQYQHFPSKASKGRLLCLKGKDTHEGAWNSYALAWPEALPHNTTLMKGLTFVSYNHYNYDNIWHGLSAIVPFVAWHLKNECAMPTRWILYHWGELRTKMGPWLRILVEATFGEPLNIEGFDPGLMMGTNHDDQEDDEENPFCFENAVVMRHNEGGMSRQRRIEVYDLLRCKARLYCNVSLKGRISDVTDKGVPVIGMTLLIRTGARSFKNESAVIDIFGKECGKVEGCKLTVAYSNNLTFCEQVRLMSSTDILVSPHGAQLTNMFLMDKNSSIMEFFPKGWLKLAGVGQYVYHWIASWSGMKHQGAWRDPDGDHCPFPDDDRRCMSIYKNGRIGTNHSYFAEWSSNVLNEVKLKKTEEASKNNISTSDHTFTAACACT